MKRKVPMKRSVKPLKRTRLKPVSDKRRKDMAVYAALRIDFLKKNPMCSIWLMLNGYSKPQINDIQKTSLIHLLDARRPPVIHAKSNEAMILCGLPYECPMSAEVHHANGRTGKNYLDTKTWIAASSQAHAWAHQNSSKARAIGVITK